jgi:predicted  nucleic acid-binding Zn-ribbon protein
VADATIAELQPEIRELERRLQTAREKHTESQAKVMKVVQQLRHDMTQVTNLHEEIER